MNKEIESKSHSILESTMRIEALSQQISPIWCGLKRFLLFSVNAFVKLALQPIMPFSPPAIVSLLIGHFLFAARTVL